MEENYIKPSKPSAMRPALLTGIIVFVCILLQEVLFEEITFEDLGVGILLAVIGSLIQYIYQNRR